MASQMKHWQRPRRQVRLQLLVAKLLPKLWQPTQALPEVASEVTTSWVTGAQLIDSCLRERSSSMARELMGFRSQERHGHHRHFSPAEKEQTQDQQAQKRQLSVTNPSQTHRGQQQRMAKGGQHSLLAKQAPLQQPLLLIAYRQTHCHREASAYPYHCRRGSEHRQSQRLSACGCHGALHLGFPASVRMRLGLPIVQLAHQ